ncbi:MAG: glycosyltransferase [Acidimicrobiia bacterium]|nr:glycosyltransferase [Acidimicrobiia bacterium]
MTDTLQTEIGTAAAPSELRAGVLVVERTGRGAVAAYTHGFCSHLSVSGPPVYLLTPKRDEQPAVSGCPEYLVAPWLRDTSRHKRGAVAWLRRALLEVVNMFVLLWTIRRLRVNVVVWESSAPRRLDPLTVRLLHLGSRRVVWVAHELAPQGRHASYLRIGIGVLAGGLLLLFGNYVGLGFLPDGLELALRVGGFYGSCIGLWMTVRWWFSERGGTWPLFVRKLYSRVDVLITFSEADAATVVNDTRARRAQGLKLPGDEVEIADKVRVVPYGDLSYLVDVQADAAACRRRLGLPLRSTVLLGITDSRDGGAEDLLDALALVAAHGVEVDAVVVNPGERGGAAELMGKAATRGLSVTAYDADPFSPDSDVFFEAADAVVLPDRVGTPTPLVLLAFAHGRPVAVTDASGGAEVVHHGSDGEVARVGDPSSLANAVTALVTPRRRLQQRQYDLAQGNERHAWDDIVARYLPVLNVGDVATGRQITTKSSNVVAAMLWIGVLFVALAATMNALSTKGFVVTNLPLIAAIAVPAAAVFLLATTIEVKIFTSLAFILVGDLVRRFVYPLPIQLVWSLAMWATVLHILIQPPPVRLRLKKTHLVHMLIILYVGWALAQVFNPNVAGVGLAGWRQFRIYVEPAFFYGCLLVYLQDRRSVRRLINWFMTLGFFALIWGTKIAIAGYFSFEKDYFNTTAARSLVTESRNVGTMLTPSSWSMWCAAIFVIALAGLLERGAFKRRWLLLPVLPLAALNTVSSGNRIALAVMAVAVPVVLFIGLGSGRTRLRALIVMALMAFAAVMLWNWIPETGGSRVGLQSKNPLAATRQKLGSIKNPKADQASIDDRLEQGTNTVNAVLRHPIGGGMGILNIANFSSALGGGQAQAGSLLGGGVNTSEARAYNVVPVKAGDYFYVNLVAEVGIPGLIVMCCLLIITWVKAIIVFMAARTPFFRVLSVAAVAWFMGNIVNSITNGAMFMIQTSAVFFMFVALTFVMPAIEDQELGPADPELGRAELAPVT